MYNYFQTQINVGLCMRPKKTLISDITTIETFDESKLDLLISSDLLKTSTEMTIN